ncbi:GspE/PulE family protein [Ammoniphilus sp. CFH 90114]|uniref:GspE/PulE family protein n=1 Tax=Ammoniphilus sp. CFH 90114 TaxID=2493665 RepID=UPI00100E44C7|nr:GspE/PulE family protein [Ammoniphilus sp. CFH 90114]RXT13637.1 type II/IV secretion system protein [Ammoniphilus sp. CFH 90114]
MPVNDVSSYLSYLLEEAVKRRASDIHLEPMPEGIQVRLRIDGIMTFLEQKEEALGPPLISRLKLMSHLDIGERRIPQDGGFSCRLYDSDMDIRVSTLPTIYGEKMVLRLLTRKLPFDDLPSLGLDDSQCRTIRKIICSSQGLLLATGPTGSGKTTTLYTILKEIHNQERNIIALEDPVEYQVPGINQVQVNVKAGLTFSSGLRASLRQDPDVIFVGEIRDKETAEIAVRAALTGHLVLSTLHTNDAASAITRLLDMGIEPYLLASAMRGIIAQRLIRQVCSCSMTEVGSCSLCHGTRYFGRQAIYEVLPIQDELYPLMMKRVSAAEIRDFLRVRGFCNLNMKLREMVRQGLTTINEYQRVLLADVE